MLFSDTAGHWARDAIGSAVKEGIVDGYPDGTFRPDQTVSEPEFLSMLLRAYPDNGLTAPSAGEAWYAPYYRYADAHDWPVLRSKDPQEYNRGSVACLIAASSGQKASITVNDAVKYLLAHTLAQGKTSATVEGYAPADKLSRAEAVTFIRNLKNNPSYRPMAADDSAVPAFKTVSSNPPTELLSSAALNPSQAALTVKGIAIGDSAASVLAKLGEPARKDPSEYGFDWYIYNQNYNEYVQVGIRGDKVVGLYSPSDTWSTNKGIKDGAGEQDVQKQYGNPLTSILKGKTRFKLNYGKDEYATYETDGAYVTFFYDLFRNHVVTGVQAIEKTTEQEHAAFYPEASDTLARAFELEVFDMANAGRAKLGLSAFAWDDAAAKTARSHSQDMADQSYFDHADKSGQSPFDRMSGNGIRYHAAAENIAAGQTSAIFAHHGWMNSEGHRKNLLSPFARLGVGVAFGGPLHIYYTQNFYTP
ncbi:CAP domain-containing protein [Paenibacillus sp. P26]|nr:CAP domain-containing protein [Paenibacillus sp. P26]UUZ97752.1 CAP domain-containing protein [Paenibacillus sp. P25]